ncbi:retrovirus-related pol polyprotein from transposon TNT 1-94 [Tanacetum coccineum]
MLLMQARENGVALDEEQLLFIIGGQDNTVDEDVDEQPVQDLALTVDNVFQANDRDAFDSDVDKAPTTQTMFMENLSSADPVYDEASPSYDSYILSEVSDHDNYQDVVCKHHEVHEMHDEVQPNYVVDSHADYTSDSNMIPYDQYVKDNIVPVVQSNVSFVPNDAYMMILNDMHEQSAQCVSMTTQNNVVDKSLTVELATYKEQVELYKRRAKFKLTEKEQKIDEQLRIVITDRNIKEENLKMELHSIKMQLNSTINHNKSMVEEVKSLKKDFKQKENKYLEEFLDIKALKEKVEDRLFKQDQSLQTVHMLCKPKPHYDEQRKDLLKMKEEALKEQTTASRPIKALMVYPPNTPATLVPKALTKEIKEMKDIFEKLEAKVDQYVLNQKYDEIEKKSILVINDNLIADCLSKEVFYIATNSELIVSRFTDMHNAHTAVQARCLDLEAELSKLHDKIQQDDHNELVKHFSNLKTNVPVIPSTRVNSCTDTSGSKPRSNTKKNRISPAKSVNKKKVEEHPMTNKSNVKTTNRVDSSISSKLNYLHSVNAYPSVKNVMSKVKKVWKPKERTWQTTYQCRTDRPLVFGLRLLKHMTRDRSRLKNFIKKFIETVRIGNDHFDAIMGYEDYVIGDSVISRHSCYVRDTNGVELINGSYGSNLYTISVKDMMKSSPICLLSKAFKNRSWLWHRRLNHLNFGTINDLAKKDLVRGLPRLKFEKDHLSSACQLGKSKKHTHTPKTENTNLEVLNTLHMNLCGPMRVQTINGKKYILVIVDDYSRFTWVKFLRSKDETPEFVINFRKQIQVGLYKTEIIAEGNEGALHLGPERARVYSDLSPEDKDRYNTDIRATNILLQGLPKDIYTLINHYTDAKDIWDNVKMLLEGSELTKEDCES